MATISKIRLPDETEESGYKEYNLGGEGTGTVTKVSTGSGLTGGDITTFGTVKANLKSEELSSLTAGDRTSIADREYPVGVDSDGKLSVNVPWTDTKGGGASISVTNGIMVVTQ